MDVDHIETYRAVLSEGTTQAAAKSLGISQSAASRRLLQLEETLGVPLFSRQKGRLIPTRESAVLRDHLLNLSDGTQKVLELAREVRAGNSESVNLRVAVPTSLTLSIVPKIVSEYLTLYPKTRIELFSGTYDTIERMLVDGRAEIGFVQLPAQNDALVTYPLGEVKTVCVLPTDHPLSAQDMISLQSLREVPLILLGRRRKARLAIESAFLDAGVRPTIRLEAHSVCSACGLVSAGLGATLVNELMGRDYDHMSVAVRPLTEHLPNHFAFATSRSVPHTQAAENFIALFNQRLERFLR